MQKFILCCLWISVLVISGCRGGVIGSDAVHASAQLVPVGGENVSGFVSFAKSGDKLRVIAEVSGLEPGMHTLQIVSESACHAKRGQGCQFCGSPTGASESPAIELPPLVSDRNGVARLTAYLSVFRIGGKKATNILERRVVVCRGRDEGRLTPADSVCDALACGVINEK